MSTLIGCASAHGPLYTEVTQHKPVASGQARIVMLRPNGRYDDYSLSKAILRVNNGKAGQLAYGGFLYVDVNAGAVTIEASAPNRMYGTCSVRINTVAGDTVYLDVSPRPAHIAADVAGTVAGAAIAGGPSEVGLDEVPIGTSDVQTAAASAAGGAVASIAEGAGKTCGGPYRVRQLQASAALNELQDLKLSE
jgi:hypothetical protein